jgi:intracellular septation protein
MTASPRWLKPVTEYGPLVVFFATYLKFGLLPATGALIAATLIGLALSFGFERRIPLMPLLTAVVVTVFGGLSLWLADETFIKLKPTIVQGLIAVALLVGLAFGKPLLRPLLGASWSMDETGWRRLTLRFACFFAAMAALNEVVWRTQSTDVWVTFKVFGILVLTVLFALAQMPLMNRHKLPEPEPEKR